MATVNLMLDAGIYVEVDDKKNNVDPYEGKIIKWKKNKPYLTKLSFTEKLYYKNIKKSKKKL